MGGWLRSILVKIRTSIFWSRITPHYLLSFCPASYYHLLCWLFETSYTTPDTRHYDRPRTHRPPAKQAGSKNIILQRMGSCLGPPPRPPVSCDAEARGRFQSDCAYFERSSTCCSKKSWWCVVVARYAAITKLPRSITTISSYILLIISQVLFKNHY